MNSPPQEDKPSFVKDFFPGYFALVMATGIVSLAMHFEGFPGLPEVLLWLNVIFYVVLWGITVLRIAWFRSALIADLTHHARGVTFLTAVAGTGVLGVQFAILTPFIALAAGLWVFAVLLWIILIYTFFAAVTVAQPRPSLEVAINGSWLLVSWEVLHDFQPFIGGFTLFFWATGTWWIPLLVIVGFWRHVIERVPVTYDPQYWSLVFPLGMYTVATLMFANAIGLPFLLIIPRIAVYIAMLAKLITFSAAGTARRTKS